MKLLYDNTNLNSAVNKYDDEFNNLNDTASIISSLSFPSGFSGSSKIRGLSSEVRLISNDILFLRDWLKKTINTYDSQLKELISDVDSIEVISIRSLRKN